LPDLLDREAAPRHTLVSEEATMFATEGREVRVYMGFR
jgi:hypothetical protein